jgi:hypothetical protein
MFSKRDPTPEDSETFECLKRSDAVSPSGLDLLVFWGWEALLRVSRAPIRHAEYVVYDDSSEQVGLVTLDPKWRDQQRERLSFVTFAARLATSHASPGSGDVPTTKYMVQPIVVDRRAGQVAYRVGWLSPWLDLGKWFELGPTVRLLVLG